MKRLAVRLLLSITAVASLAAPAWAGEREVFVRCDAIEGGSPELARYAAVDRLRFIERRLSPDSNKARIYSWAWGGTFAGVAAYELVQSRNDELSGRARTRMYVESASALLTPTIILAMPLHAMEDAEHVRSLAHRAGRDLDPCVALSRAESLLERDAKSEAMGVHWMNHVFAIGSNAALAAFLTVGTHGNARLRGEALLFAGGMLSSELQIATQPTGAVDALDDYRSATLDVPLDDEPTIAVAPMIYKDGGGVAVGLRF